MNADTGSTAAHARSRAYSSASLRTISMSAGGCCARLEWALASRQQGRRRERRERDRGGRCAYKPSAHLKVVPLASNFDTPGPACDLIRSHPSNLAAHAPAPAHPVPAVPTTGAPPALRRGAPGLPADEPECAADVPRLSAPGIVLSAPSRPAVSSDGGMAPGAPVSALGPSLEA